MTTDTHSCDCSPDHPGILWPWGSDGSYPPALPYVERCDTCSRYANDDDAASALVAGLLAVGLEPVIGEHLRRATADYEHWVAHGRPEHRGGVYVFPSPAAIHCTTDRPDWELYVACAKSSLALAGRDAFGERPQPRREVFVVRPPDAMEDVAAFEREPDATAFRQTYVDDGAAIGDVERVTVCDPVLAARMVAERQTDENAVS